MLFRDGQMYGIAGRELPMSQDNLLGPLCRSAINRQHLVDDAEQGVECRLDGVSPINGDIAVHNLLQHLGIGDEAAQSLLARARRALREVCKTSLWVDLNAEVTNGSHH